MDILSKQKLELQSGDTCHVEVVIIDSQPEGNYVYIPEPDDKITMVVYTDDAEEPVMEIEAASDDDLVYFDIDTSEIALGEYKYDVIIRIAASEAVHHVSVGEKIIIK